jgi:prepilin-type N-terminal cleavage/methylation domain-containing protein
MKNLHTLLKSKKGFTLIELLVVIAIIGILATLVLLQLGTARSRARDAKRIADVSQLRSAIELYYEDNGGKYPGDFYASKGIFTKYLTNIPVDPLNSSLGYGYKTKDANKYSYQVWTELEQRAGGALNADADINASAWTGEGTARGGVNGATETCADSDLTNSDCVYDLGTIND